MALNLSSGAGAILEKLGALGFERVRRALAALSLSFFAILYLFLAFNAPEGWGPAFGALSGCYLIAFFAVVGSTTAFVRFNYPPIGWPTGIAAMTISFGIGQTLGPIAVGAITDAFGSLSYALNVSAAMLAVAAIAAAFQRKLPKTS